MADGGGFADDDAGAVVDEEMRADARAGMEIAAGAFVGIFGEHARQQRNAEPVKLVRETLHGDREHAGVGEDDLLEAAGGGIAAVGGVDVGLDNFAQRG